MSQDDFSKFRTLKKFGLKPTEDNLKMINNDIDKYNEKFEKLFIYFYSSDTEWTDKDAYDRVKRVCYFFYNNGLYDAFKEMGYF